jgi:hypothetical protein
MNKGQLKPRGAANVRVNIYQLVNQLRQLNEDGSIKKTT